MPVACPIYLWITLQQCHSSLRGYSIHNKQLCTGEQKFLYTCQMYGTGQSGWNSQKMNVYEGRYNVNLQMKKQYRNLSFASAQGHFAHPVLHGPFILTELKPLTQIFSSSVYQLGTHSSLSN